MDSRVNRFETIRMAPNPRFRQNNKGSRSTVSQARADRVDRLLKLEAVRRHAVLEIPRDGLLDPIAEIARRMIGCKAAVIDIVDREHLFKLSHPGEDQPPVDDEVRFASVARDGDDELGSGTLPFDPRVAADAVGAQDLGFGFYAGLPLRTADGHMLGTLALVDPEPRAIDDVELDSLKLVAGVVVDMIELRLAARAKVAAAECKAA